MATDNNTAIGSHALEFNAKAAGNINTPTSNTANGFDALYNNLTGSNNVALGIFAGRNATTGNGNVYIGHSMEGVAGEANHTYIRNINITAVGGAGTDTVTVDLTTGLLGHLSSSRCYKEDIKPIDTASEAVFSLKPVDANASAKITTMSIAVR